jgi:uncharacterized protein YycO
VSNYARVERYEIDAPDAVLAYAVSQLGKKYDWSGVFNFIEPNRNWQEDDSWFCSELVAKAFLEAGTPLINAPAHRVAPGDLLHSFLLKPVLLSGDKP